MKDAAKGLLEDKFDGQEEGAGVPGGVQGTLRQHIILKMSEKSLILVHEKCLEILHFFDKTFSQDLNLI